MLFSPRHSTRETAQLCQRLSIAIDAGIDVRKIWADETNRAAPGFAKSRFRKISAAVNDGQSMAEALATTGNFFPVLMRELAAVGEETGKLDAVFKQLAEHYQRRLQLRRNFFAAIIWPMIQLSAAIVVIGLLIWIMGVISSNPIDILGFGLVGNRGLAIYITFIASMVAITWLIIRAINRGLVWTRLIQYLLIRLPVLGKTVEKLCLAQFVWTFYITLESGMEIRRAVRLSLRSTNNAHFSDRAAEIEKAISQGTSLHRAFSDTRCFPAEFLDALAVGEQSGRLSQTMENLARQYQDQARSSTAILAYVAGFAVWLAVAAVIIMMIFRLAGFYLGTINDALNMT